MIGRRALVAGAVSLLTAPLAAEAQPAGKVHRIGTLSTSPRERVMPFLRSLEQELRNRGHAVGQSVIMEHRFAEGKVERLPELAADLVRMNVDVIVTGVDANTVAAKQATSTIPIVMVLSADPVGLGFVASLAQPGGNITGLSATPTAEMWGKRFQLLAEAVPGISRLAFLWGAAASAAQARNVVQNVATSSRVMVQWLEIHGPKDLHGAFAMITEQRADAFLFFVDPVIWPHQRRVAELAVKYRLPAVANVREFADAGGLMSYGVSTAGQYRRAASYVDRILRGTRPADLPVEQPTSFEMVINLKTAKSLGLTIPPAVLARADEVIE